MRKPKSFRSALQLEALIDTYFQSLTNQTSKSARSKTIRQEPITFSGLLLFAGFNSLEEFEQYRVIPKFAAVLDRAKLRILEVYEKRLQTHFSGGAKYAIDKLLGHNDEETSTGKESDNVFLVEVVHSHLKPVSSESEVIL